MENHEVILQDQNLKRHKVIRVRDTVFNSQTLMESSQWLWVYAKNHEFFPFELWSALEKAHVNQTIRYKDEEYKVIKVKLIKKQKYT